MSDAVCGDVLLLVFQCLVGTKYDVFCLTRDSAFHWTVTESQEAASVLLVFEELSVMI